MLREKSQDRDVDASLFRVIVEQFVARRMHARSEVLQFERLILGLMDSLDAEAVASVAQPLCAHPETPESVITKLFDIGGRCALIAFEFAPNVPSRDLLARAEHGGVEEAVAIARRPDLDRAVVATLASRREAEILESLAANRTARLDRATLRGLTQAARDNLRLGRILLDRNEPGLDPEPLFLAATHLERAAIMLEATKSAFVDPVPESAPRAPGETVARNLELAARREGLDAAAEVLAEALDCRRSRARAILADKSGEALALALVVLGISEENAIRVFLRADPQIAHDVARVRSLVGLMRFIPSRAARRIVASMTGTLRAERETQRRNLFPDGAKGAVGAGRQVAPSRSAGDLNRSARIDQAS
jgi:uncharacterized protein (DUF2336 family)